MNLVYEIFVAVSSATTHRRCLQIWHTLLFGMPYGRNNFCANGMPTSCISVGLSEECIWNIVYRKFLCSFLSNYLLQMLGILTHSSFWHTIWWVHFFTNPMLTSCLYMKFSSQFPQQPLCSGAWNFSIPYILIYQPHGGNHFCMNSMSTSCLFFYLSIYKAYFHGSNKFLSERGYCLWALAHRFLVVA